jgi:DNA-binding transcriptional MerR regulator
MPPDDMLGFSTLSIGELAALTGATVKTVRFYSDRGLLPEAGRSGGGHRRYHPGSAARLRAIRSLRSLGVSVPEIARTLDGPGDTGGADPLDSALSRRLDELGSQLTALRWREAALHALRSGGPEQRAELLGLIGTVDVPPSTAALARYWRRVLPRRLSARLRSAVTEAAVPQPPAEPTPGQVIAFARLHALVTAATDQCLASHQPVTAAHPDLLYDGLHEAYLLAESARLDEAVDCYAAAHARASGTRDTPGFRRALFPALTAADHPVMSRYWQLAAELTPHQTLGAADLRLRTALAANLRAAG